MIRLWSTSRAKRAAISTIRPLVETSRARLGGIPDNAWHTPYVLGFMSMLIALIAKQHTHGRIDSDRLGLTQVEAFSRITGVVDDLIGEQICFLSAIRDERFLGGCRNALLFLKAYNGEHDPTDPDVIIVCETAPSGRSFLDDSPEGDTSAFGRGGIIAAALWQQYFDQHLR